MKGFSKATFISVIALMVIVGLGRAGFGFVRRRLAV